MCRSGVSLTTCVTSLTYFVYFFIRQFFYSAGRFCAGVGCREASKGGGGRSQGNADNGGVGTCGTDRDNGDVRAQVTTGEEQTLFSFIT